MFEKIDLGFDLNLKSLHQGSNMLYHRINKIVVK